MERVLKLRLQVVYQVAAADAGSAIDSGIDSDTRRLCTQCGCNEQVRTYAAGVEWVFFDRNMPELADRLEALGDKEGRSRRPQVGLRVDRFCSQRMMEK